MYHHNKELSQIDNQLIETLQLIIDRYEGRTKGSVFIHMEDFPWYNERNGQITRLNEMGLITKPLFCDNGVRVTLTERGRHFFDVNSEPMGTLTKEQMIKILTGLSTDIMTSYEEFGYADIRSYWIDVDRMVKMNLIQLGRNPKYDNRNTPIKIWMDGAAVTADGYSFLEEMRKTVIELPHEFISACAKIADNPASYATFDEDGLNREIRNFLVSALDRFGYSINDQTQQGLGSSGKKPGELDIRINKDGIPLALFEGLIHKDKRYLYDHINKVIGRYNQSGCKEVYVVEYSNNKGFCSFWNGSIESVEEYPGIEISETNTNLMGVKMLEGTFDWHGNRGRFYYIGVNCYIK